VTLELWLAGRRGQAYCDLLTCQLAHYISAIRIRYGAKRDERDRFIDQIIASPILSRLESLTVEGDDEPRTDLLAGVNR
jgi:hypothetical protein